MLDMSRKVRTPQSTKPGKSRDGATCQTGPQKHTAHTGKGEMVVQETTGNSSNAFAGQPLSGARSNRSMATQAARLISASWLLQVDRLDR